MRRILGPAGVALALVVLPTTAVAACRPTDGPRYDAHIAYRFLTDRGALLEDVQAAGNRVAWIASTTRGNRWAAVVTVTDARTGRRLSRRTVASWRRSVDPDELSDPNIVLTTRGELGWIVELDRAPAGSLSALRVEGETVAWSHDGQPRFAPAP